MGTGEMRFFFFLHRLGWEGDKGGEEKEMERLFAVRLG
jgi:hypothetical protein